MLIGLTVPVARSMGPADAIPTAPDHTPGGLYRVGDHPVSQSPNLFCAMVLRRRLGSGLHQHSGLVDEAGGDLGAADVEGQGEHAGLQCRWVLSG